jgi:hypothetical protein
MQRKTRDQGSSIVSLVMCLWSIWHQVWEILLSYRRKSMQPYHLELTVFLRLNKELWNELTINEMLKVKLSDMTLQQPARLLLWLMRSCKLLVGSCVRVESGKRSGVSINLWLVFLVFIYTHQSCWCTTCQQTRPHIIGLISLCAERSELSCPISRIQCPLNAISIRLLLCDHMN